MNQNINIQTFYRNGNGTFVPIAALPNRKKVDCEYLSGGITMTIGHVDLITLELWDDINWLWPFIVQSLSVCLESGHGGRYFPSQPVKFDSYSNRAQGQLVLTVKGPQFERTAYARAEELLPKVANEVRSFYRHYGEACTMDASCDQILALVDGWEDYVSSS
ncbi:MAG: hypothetical protein AAGA37_22375 [Actinomycetota bacterium]